MARNITQSVIKSKIASTFISAQQLVEKNLPNLWEEVYGQNEIIIQGRLDSIEETITTVVTDMIREEEANREEFLADYDKLLAEAHTLERELSIVVPRRDVAEEPLFVRIQSLEDDLKAHRKVREERMAALHMLQEKEKMLCTMLKDKCLYADFNSVPSEAKLVEIQNHINSLKTTLTARQEQYTTLRGQIMHLWATLELEPEDSFEHQVQKGEMLTGADDLASLETLLTKLENIEAQMKEDLENLHYQLSQLWTRLNTGSREREKFLLDNDRICGRTLDAFKEQIKICTALKLTRIKEIVGAVRDELSDWWGRVHFSQEQMNEFAEFKLEHDITEEVLVKHEQEVERVKQYFEENCEIIELLEQRFSLWEEMVLLENKANDKDRLFSNRGGQLLMEEKKRKFIQKELPKVEKKLEKLLDAYEGRTGQSFLYEGQDAREMMASQWESRNKSKENLKQAKKNVTSSSAWPRPLGVTQSMCMGLTPDKSKTLKRKGDATPLMEPKRRLLNSATKQNVMGSSTALNATNVSKAPLKATRNTPVPNKTKLPDRSKLISPKVRTRVPVARTPAPVYGLRRSRSHVTLTPQVNGPLTRTRSQIQFSATPKNKQRQFIL